MGGYTIHHQHTHEIDEDYKNYVVMNKSNHSYGINRKIIEMFHSNSWANHRCFIIGGGPSVKNFDFSILDHELTIGINKTFEYYPKAKINYAMDSSLYDSMRNGKLDEHAKIKVWDRWMGFGGVRVFLTPMEIKEFGKEVYLVRRNWKPSVNRGDLNDGIYGGRNSGLGAIMLAIALGANPIYLLGYDMKAKTNTHWHEGYPNRDINDFNQKLSEYRDEITNVSTLIKQRGIVVMNLNPDSDLKCFPTADLNLVLKEITSAYL